MPVSDRELRLDGIEPQGNSPEPPHENNALLDAAAIRQELLHNGPGCFRWLDVAIDASSRTITVRGKLPSFYLRQLLRVKLFRLGAHAVRDETIIPS